MADRRGVIDVAPSLLVHERPLARFPDAVRHHVHRAIERNLRPLSGARRAIFHFRFAPRMREQLIGGSAFGTKISLADRRFRVALDRNQLPIFVIDGWPQPTPQYGQIERATSASSVRACIARVFSDIASSRCHLCARESGARAAIREGDRGETTSENLSHEDGRLTPVSVRAGISALGARSQITRALSRQGWRDIPANSSPPSRLFAASECPSRWHTRLAPWS